MPEPTKPEVRCALAKSMLEQRPHDDRLVELLCAVLRGVVLGEVVDEATP